MTKKNYSITWIVFTSFLKLASLFILIFILPWNIYYWQGWGFVILIFITAAIILIIFKNKTDLINERIKPSPGIIMTIGPILGSYWAMIPGGLWVVALIIRTYFEDKTLQKELEGYKEYAKKTKYRLIPGIWAFLICMTIFAGCTAQQQTNELITYEGPWFDIRPPSGFTSVDMGFPENYNGVLFSNKDNICNLYVYSPQWADKSGEEEMHLNETLISEEINGNVTKRIFKDNDSQNLREVEIIEENEGTVRYMFFYGHPENSDPCRTEYEQFKDSLIQYAD